MWPLTQGQGVTVAVIDSGISSDHPVFAHRRPAVVDVSGAGPRDCAGHGTGVAAIIGGRPFGAFHGAAPGARLLAIKQQDSFSDPAGGGRLAKAIRTAVDRGARVINISISTPDNPGLRAAVRYAQGNDVVIVAAAGNAEREGGATGPAYPAGYADVISVTSVGPDGALSDTSNTASRVDLAAPGKDVVTAWAGGGFTYSAEGGTSYAAPYVAGVAALVRSYHPNLPYRQVIRRILATADGGAAGTGRGMVDPLQAVSAVLPDGPPGSGATAVASPGGPARVTDPEPADRRTRTVAFALTAGALGVAGAAALVGLVLPAGRRRGWRPGRVRTPPLPADPPAGPDADLPGGLLTSPSDPHDP